MIVRNVRQIEVENLDGAFGRDDDVAGLEIAVDHALFMRGLERFGDLPADF